MNGQVFLTGLMALLLSVNAAGRNVPTAAEIIEQSDRIRNPAGSFSMKVQIIEYKAGRREDDMLVVVHSKPETGSGMYRTLVEIREPVRDSGKLILRNSQDLWFYDPASQASVRISPQQRLLGQVSNGDVMSSNFAADYSSRLIGEERVKDASRRERSSYRLELLATNNDVVYPKIEYWVDTDGFYPVKGKFYANSGRLLKIAYYRDFREILGGERPGEVLIVDGVDPSQITRMRLSDHTKADIPDHWFQRSWLARHREQP